MDDMHLKEIEQKGEKSSSIEDLEVTIATVKEESENKNEDRLSKTQFSEGIEQILKDCILSTLTPKTSYG